jgi:hypothetical protein
MKTLKTTLTIISLSLTQTVLTVLFAQNSLDSLRIKCQTEGYSSTYMENSSEGDSVKTVQITIEDNRRLLDEFLEAFKKERNKASSIMQKKENNRLFSEIYFFNHGKTFVSYSYILKNDGSGADITYMEGNSVTPVHVKIQEEEKDNFRTKTKYLIPKGGHLFVNGEKLTAKQAKEAGMDVEEF